jgi:hypothetical protein
LTSWLIALLWSYKRQTASALTTVSFIFSPNLGALFEKNMSRMIGTALGLIMGNLPATLLFQQGKTKFVDPYTGIPLYLMMSYAMWVCTIYGYLAKRFVGANWSYAFLLWGAFGGSEMLSYLAPGKARGDQDYAGLFQSTMDSFMGCMIVFCVDIAYARVTANRGSDIVEERIPECVIDVGKIVGNLIQAGQGAEAEKTVEVLKGHIVDSRYWDAEIRKMDLVLNSLRNAPYKGGFIVAVLDQLDDAYVASWSICQGLKRCEATQDDVERDRLRSDTVRTFQEVVPVSTQELVSDAPRTSKSSSAGRGTVQKASRHQIPP